MATLKICTGHTCTDYGSKYLFDRAQVEIESKDSLQIEPCGCLGLCEKAINITIEGASKKCIYSQVTGPKLAQIIKTFNQA